MAIDPSLLEAETVERAERYLTLPFPLSAVVMVDSLEVGTVYTHPAAESVLYDQRHFQTTSRYTPCLRPPALVFAYLQSLERARALVDQDDEQDAGEEGGSWFVEPSPRLSRRQVG